MHKNLYIPLLFLSIFGLEYCVPLWPYADWNALNTNYSIGQRIPPNKQQNNKTTPLCYCLRTLKQQQHEVYMSALSFWVTHTRLRFVGSNIRRPLRSLDQADRTKCRANRLVAGDARDLVQWMGDLQTPRAQWCRPGLPVSSLIRMCPVVGDLLEPNFTTYQYIFSSACRVLGVGGGTPPGPATV